MDLKIHGQDNAEDENGSRRVESMDALLFTVALEVALLQMQIVEGCAALRSARLSAERDSPLFLLREKLANDRKEVTEIVRSCLVEIAQEGTWRSLRKAIDVLHRRSSEYTTKRNYHINLRRTHILTREDLKDKRKQNIGELRHADRKITLLRDKKELQKLENKVAWYRQQHINLCTLGNKKDDKVNTKFRLSYAEKWLGAQAEGLELSHSAPRAPLPTAGHEQRVHHETDRAYQLQIAERKKAVEYWRLKYADDTAKINVLLAEKREQLRVTVARREELQALFTLHEGEMRAWSTFKRERATRLAREAKNRDAATRVQSWWRGVMVRRALGPFKFLRHAKKSATKQKKK